MSDLTDDELELALTIGDRLETMNRRAYVDRESLALAGRLQRAAAEIRRHRAARAADTSDVKRGSEAEQALVRRFEPIGVRNRTAAEYGALLGAARGAIDMAVRDADGNVDTDNALEIMRKALNTPARADDRERVRAVVHDAICEMTDVDETANSVADALACPAPTLSVQRVRAVVMDAVLGVTGRGKISLAVAMDNASRIADRVADALATPAPALIAERVRAVVRESALPVLEDQAATVVRGGGVLRNGTAERRQALEFCADAIADRVAEQLAGAVLTVVLSEEEFGLLHYLVGFCHEAFGTSQTPSQQSAMSLLLRLIAAHRKAP